MTFIYAPMQACGVTIPARYDSQDVNQDGTVHEVQFGESVAKLLKRLGVCQPVEYNDWYSVPYDTIAWSPGRGFITGTPIWTRDDVLSDSEVRLHRSKAKAARWFAESSKDGTLLACPIDVEGVGRACYHDEYRAYCHLGSSITGSQYRELAALISRYRRIVRSYETTVSWQEIPGSARMYADGSFEADFLASDGRVRRHVLMIAPRGDASY